MGWTPDEGTWLSRNFLYFGKLEYITEYVNTHTACSHSNSQFCLSFSACSCDPKAHLHCWKFPGCLRQLVDGSTWRCEIPQGSFLLSNMCSLLLMVEACLPPGELVESQCHGKMWWSRHGCPIAWRRWRGKYHVCWGWRMVKKDQLILVHCPLLIGARRTTLSCHTPFVNEVPISQCAKNTFILEQPADRSGWKAGRAVWNVLFLGPLPLYFSSATGVKGWAAEWFDR